MEGQYMDVEGYDALAFRMRGDGRKYIANLRTANWIVGEENSHDVWQAFLLARLVKHAQCLTIRFSRACTASCTP
jgi:hypothetical protein